MPRGGARKGAGRKPKPLAEKIAAKNPGRRELTKAEFLRDDYDPSEPPEILDSFIRVHDHPTDRPSEIYRESVKYIEPSGCLHLIPQDLLSQHAIAKYNFLQAQFESRFYPIVGKDEKGNVEISKYLELVLKQEKTMLAIWQVILDIVFRNSERAIDVPEMDAMQTMFGGRKRREVKANA